MLSMWASAKVRERYSEVEQEDEGRLSIAQDSFPKSTDFLGRILAPVDERGRRGSLRRTCAPQCHGFPLEDRIW